MKSGNWIPLDKGLSTYLPNDRPYTRLEAMFSYTCDIDNGINKTVRGYAKLWQWSRKKTCKFLHDIKTKEGFKERYSQEEKRGVTLKTNNLQQEKTISKTKRATQEPQKSHKRATQEPGGTLIIKDLQNQKNHSGATKEPLKSHSGATTIYTKTKRLNTKDKKTYMCDFDIFWNSYGKKVDKKSCLEWWRINVTSDEILKNITAGLERYKKTDRFKRGFILDPIRFLKNERYLDEWIEPKQNPYQKETLDEKQERLAAEFINEQREKMK